MLPICGLVPKGMVPSGGRRRVAAADGGQRRYQCSGFSMRCPMRRVPKDHPAWIKCYIYIGYFVIVSGHNIKKKIAKISIFDL